MIEIQKPTRYICSKWHKYVVRNELSDMGRYVTLYFEGSRIPHLEMNWNLNHKGLNNWASDNYKYYHSGAGPQPTLYEVTSDSKYTRKHFHDTVIHYWKELKTMLRSSNTHFFPRNGEMVCMNLHDSQYYEKWLKKLVHFARE